MTPQWHVVTMYLVTTNSAKLWSAYDNLTAAAKDYYFLGDDFEPHVWKVQIGQPPRDVTLEAIKLLEGL